MKHKLCVCNGCDAILIDHNPQTGAEKIEVPDDIHLKETIWIPDSESNHGDEFLVCPYCMTDSYLGDIFRQDQITVEERNGEHKLKLVYENF